MKIHWLSNNPLTPTGYGKQTKLFVPRIDKLGHKMSLTANYGTDGFIFIWQGFPVYPKAYDLFAMDVVNQNARHEGADIIITLYDSWIMDAGRMQDHGLRWCPWFPVDSEPMPPDVKTAITPAFRRIVYSHFAEQMCQQADLPCSYVPHGVDTQIFKLMDRKEAREKCGLPEDAYIIGMVAANKDNPSRKNFVEQISAFEGFKRRHPDAMLYLHTAEYSPAGVNLKELVENSSLRIGPDVRFCDQHRYVVGGFSDQDLAQLYNSFDVLTSVSAGEGFGIPIIEAQACGCPVIVGGWTSMPELVFSGRHVYKSDAIPFYTPQGAFQFIPQIAAIEKLYETEYSKPSSRAKAVEGAQQYDADLVTEKYWKPVLAEIESAIGQSCAKQDGVKQPSPGHAHQWAGIGLWNADGQISFPCTGCNDEKIVDPAQQRETIIEKGFTDAPNGVQIQVASEEKDGISKIVLREIERDYHLDGIQSLAQGGWVLDIGAHIGLVTIYLAKRYPQAKIMAFEPIKKNYEHLLKNLDANGCSVNAANYAVTADGRDVLMEANPANSGGATIYHGSGDIVESAAIGQLLVNRIALLKIDCEGAEYEIFDALRDDQIRSIGAIRGELHGQPGKNSADLLARLKALVPDTIMTVNG